MTGFIGDLTGQNAAKRADRQNIIAADQEATRQSALKWGEGQINDTFSGTFNPDFYDRTKQGYLDFATPQLNDQYSKAQKQLAFSLDRAGTLDSSIRSQREGKLHQDYDAQAQNLASTANANANGLRSQVEGARSGLISSLNATGDTASSVNSALSQAATLSQPQKYSAIGDLFAGTTSALAQQAALDKSAAIANGTYTAPFSFMRGGSAIKVTP